MVNLFAEFEKSALSRPEAVCVSLNDRSWTYENILASSKRLAAKLRELAPGDSESELNIGLFAPNVPGFLVGFYGTLAADKVVAPINFLLQPNEIMTIGMHAGLRILIAAGPLYEKLQEMTGNLPLTILRAEDFMQGTDVPDLPSLSRSDDDTAVLMYTSGTTGAPKGVELTHTNITDNCHNMQKVYDLCAEHTFVCVLPLFHSFGLSVMMVLSNLIGARLVLIPQFKPQDLAAVFNRCPRCLFIGVAPMFEVLAHLAGSKGIAYPNLELSVAGAAPLPMAVKEKYEKATGLELLQGYGLTEASPVVSVNLPGRHKPGTIGRPIPNVEVQIWDDEGTPLPAGEIGELMVRGKNVMKGYYKNPVETGKAITPEGWLHTGDLASIDGEGYITIAGRKKELIICAGENIYPLEIEDILTSHPAVAEAAVIGIPHPTKGEEPKAYIQPVPGVQVDPAELRRLCREKLAPFKVPAEIEVREDLPKGPTGKVLKRVLASELRK